MDVLSPWLAAAEVERVDGDEAGVRMHIRTMAASATSPACGTTSERVHARYQRRVVDR